MEPSRAKLLSLEEPRRYMTEGMGVTDRPKFPPVDHLKIPPSSQP